METIRKKLNIELDEIIGHMIAKKMYDEAIGMLETFKEHFDRYEHYKGIIKQNYRF